MKRLNIGCGKCYLPPSEGWTNLDIFESVRADVYGDMTALPFEKNTFDLIYSAHVLEHQSRLLILSTLAHWRDILKPGGTLRLAVPNFEAVCVWYSQTHNLKELIGLLYGGQNHPRNSHQIIFDKSTLTEALVKAGFIHIQEWNWRTTDHAQWDDYSQCVLPHMQKNSHDALSMSLNLEATKPA